MRIRGNFNYTLNVKSIRSMFLAGVVVLMSGVILISMDEVAMLLAGKLTMYVSMVASPRSAINALIGGNTKHDDITDGSHRLPTDIVPPEEIEPIPEDIDTTGIPKEYQAPLVEETFAPSYNEALYARHNGVMIRNYTKHSTKSIEDILKKDFKGSYKGDEPIVLIYHTHATESYEKYDSNIYDTRNTWRDTDNTNNMVEVGRALVEELEKLGVKVIHDTNQYDSPSYTGAYTRSREMLDEYMKKYPNIVMTLDIHRDGIVRDDDVVVKPTITHGGEKYAQLMLIAPCQSPTVKAPMWKENLRFATKLQSKIEEQLKGISRPILLDYRKYNLDVTPASLLIEVGSNGNTLEEAKRSIRLMAKPIAELLEDAFEQE